MGLKPRKLRQQLQLVRKYLRLGCQHPLVSSLLNITNSATAETMNYLIQRIADIFLANWCCVQFANEAFDFLWRVLCVLLLVSL